MSSASPLLTLIKRPLSFLTQIKSDCGAVLGAIRAPYLHMCVAGQAGERPSENSTYAADKTEGC